MADLTPQDYNEWLLERPWNPQPLHRETAPEEYPIEFLPPVIANAVKEVQAYVQAPMAMVVACALSVVSAAVQTRFDVRRDSVLTGPSSLYFLTVAESGERKTAIDKLFMTPLRDWEARQARAAREAKALYESELEAWELRGEGLKKQLAQVDHSSQPPPLADPLKMHEASRPKQKPTPRMLRGEDTTEALLIDMQNYPVAAVISAEAGMIFGGHSMRSEQVMGNLATINVMWDGGPIKQGRVSREPISIERLRATFGLQLQPATLHQFMEKTGGLARGIGYFARFLFSHPASTQGSRFYIEPKADMPALRAFCDRVTFLLDLPAEFDEFDRIEPLPIDLNHEARHIWSAFHDEVEEEVGGDNYYSRVKDVASKAAENAARLACCFHIFGMDLEPEISGMTMVNACVVMRWYLNEAVRFGQVAGMTDEVRNAEVLEIWLVQQMRMKREGPITVNMIRQKGPGALRVRTRLDAALVLLVDHGRIRVTKGTGTKTEYVTIAPQVVKEWS